MVEILVILITRAVVGTSVISPTPAPEVPAGTSVFVQMMVAGGVGAAIVTAIATLIQIPLNKKLRSPADKLASEDFAYRVLKERLDEANADREVLTKTVTFLRESHQIRDEADRADFAREQERQSLIRDLNLRNEELLIRIRKYEARLEALAAKVKLGLPITLADIYDTDPVATLGDLEDTALLG